MPIWSRSPSCVHPRYTEGVPSPSVLDQIREDVREHQRTDTPRLWRVLLHNDDYTTQEFVVWVLQEVFQRSQAEAHAIMMHVHMAGVGVACIYTRDVAETRQRQTLKLAEQEQYPLQVSIEPEGVPS